MAAMLKLTHRAIGAEVRRGTYDIVVDGERAGSVEMNDNATEVEECAGVRANQRRHDAVDGPTVIRPSLVVTAARP